MSKVIIIIALALALGISIGINIGNREKDLLKDYALYQIKQKEQILSKYNILKEEKDNINGDNI